MKKSPLFVASLAVVFAVGVLAQNSDKDKNKGKGGDSDWQHGKIRHVLLISVDGMHAVDFLTCSQGIPSVNNGAPFCPNLASLATTGINYTAASTSKPSDSFPGLMNIMTGATPRTMGVYYDVAYDRTLSPPATTTGNGNASGPCTPGTITGYSTEFDEGIDINQGLLNGGAPGAGLTDGGIASIEVSRLDRDPNNGCNPVYPWDFVRTNTIFGVIHKAGGYTAWSDKHPAYSAVSGPGGGNVDDYYSPEINSNVVDLPNVSTPTGVSCATPPDPNADLTAWTNSFLNIQCYDQIKVNAVLDWIDGRDHDGNKTGKVPAVFGMNYQAVSVGQKLIESGVHGGYLDAAGTPTSSLLSEIQFVDATIGQMIQQIKDRGLYESTLIIITAKHGQSPIDPNRYSAVPGKNNNGESPATVLYAAGYIPTSENPGGALGATEDDVSLLWLNSGTNTVPAVQLLESDASTIGLGQIYYGPTLSLNYNVPGLPPDGDPRTPDIIVTPNIGVTYTGSAKKLAEHGGFSHDDTNVILLVSNPAIVPRTVFNSVATTQIAPTVLRALGLDPSALDGVRLEGTTALPDLSRFIFPTSGK
jgi:hypothetical protein